MKTSFMAGVLLVAGIAAAEVTSEISRDEFKCASAVRAGLARQSLAHLKCIQACEVAAAKVGGPWDDCAPPYGGTTATCLNDGDGAAGKGAENVSLATMLRSCPEDGARDTCPESYEETFGSCAEMAARRVSDDHGTFSLFTTNVICEHQNFVTDPVEGKKKAKCETAIGKTLAGHFGRVTKVYQRCNATIRKGKVEPGACVPGATTHPKLSPGNVVPELNEKAAAFIDRRCFSGNASAPACYDGTGFRPDTGAGWMLIVNAYIESTVNGRTFVASPSGAFLDE